MQKISLLGSTGSIGKQALEVVRAQKSIKVVGLAANSNIELLSEQIAEFRPVAVSVTNPEKADELRKKSDVEVYSGKEGLCRIAALPEADTVLTAVVGFAGLKPTIEAAAKGKKLCIANKESLVVGGELLTRTARKHNSQIIPVDSEHSAIFQAMRCGKKREVSRIILTASGGPFRGYGLEQLQNVSVEEALRHPTWKMGNRVTIDSATLMNKGFEIIEAHHLFGMPYSKIDVVIHPQSIIHSMVEFVDGSLISQMGVPSMKIPISVALNYPSRVPGNGDKLELAEVKCLSFEKPQKEFECLQLAREAGIIGGTLPAVLNAADEVAVDKFINGRLPFIEISKVVREVMNGHALIKNPEYEDLAYSDAWARKRAEELVG